MCFCFFVPRIMYVFSLPVFIAKAIGSFTNLPCKREDCCLAVNSLECQTSILFIKSVIGQVISLQLAVLLISSHNNLLYIYLFLNFILLISRCPESLSNLFCNTTLLKRKDVSSFC